MPLEVGTTLGVYEVLAAIGAGGMGEVYKARDTKLDRDVALKILPDAFVNDPERLARFQREAKVLASLNHPNIAQIHGLEESGDSPALVLEYVPGPTLQDRIAKGPIPLDEALPIARQIAEALEAAHEQGIIHRDLKPANVKVKDDGTVKVLDFGLAKALSPGGEGMGEGDANSPTMTMTAAATKMGVIMGTAAYMSPEQARGKTVDKRADIWAFGVVLYEMLTGRQAFGGTDVSLTLAAVLRQEMDWTELPSETPHSIRRLLRRCLQRDHRRRLPEIGTARLEIDEADAAPDASPVATAAPVATAFRQRPLVASAALALALLVGGLGVWTTTRFEPSPADVVRLTIVPPESAPLSFFRLGHDLAVAPDGSFVVYHSGPGLGLSLRRIGEFDAAPLRGGGGVSPFVSPDGAWVGFTDLSMLDLIKVSVLGGPPVTLTNVGRPIRGATWGRDDQIVFGTADGGLFRVAGGGGEAEALTTPDPDRREVSHRGPFIIPGREAVLFFTTTQSTGVVPTAQLAVLDLSSGDVKPLDVAGASPHYVSTGHLVYAAEDGSVRAAPFDVETLEVTGNPVPLIEGVAIKNTGAADFSISETGRLVYALGAIESRQRLSFVWVDRTGGEEPVGADPANYQGFDLSPDGTRVAVNIEGDDPAVWIYDLIRDTTTRLTFESQFGAYSPLWTPDGTRVAFGPPLAWKRADGTGEVERLGDDDFTAFPHAFSPDGAALVSWANLGLWMQHLDGDREETVLLDDSFNESGATLSPDGQWLAYTSNESGRPEVYVRPFPDVDAGRWQVSTDGGDVAVWNPVDNELFYRGPTSVMALTYEADPTFTPGTLTELFEWVGPGGRSGTLAVSPDGQRFLLLRGVGDGMTAEDAASPEIHVVLNWHQELLERVPVP